MKLKVSLDPNSLKQGLIEHFEKVLFGLVVLCCLLLVYKAVAREGRLSWGPAELIADAKRAEARIQDAHTINTKVPDVKRFGDAVSLSKVPEDPYRLPVLKPGSPLDPGLARRGMPKLFPVRDLQVAGGHGKFAMSDEEEIQTSMTGDVMGGGAMMGQFKGQRWAVITALIDYKKQRDAYETVFQEAAHHSPNDWPQYVYYYVERAEVDPRSPSAEPTWQRLKTTDAMYVMTYWNASFPEVVDPTFLPPPTPDGIELAFPLGPLQDRMWGTEVAHPPEIPLLEPETAMAGGPMAGTMMYPGMGGMVGKSARAGKRSEKPGEEDAAAEEPEPGTAAAKARDAAKKAAERRIAARKALQANTPDAPSMPGGAVGAAGMGGMEETPGYRTRMPRGPSSPGYGPMSGAGPGRMMASPRYPTASRGPSSEDSSYPYGGARRPGTGYGPEGYGDGTWMEELQEPDVLLFRFFDFKVEEGKQYRYRVQLVLANPNYGVNPQYLERDDLGVQPFLHTIPSDPSPVVAIPRDSQALVVSAKGPSATLMLVHFNYRDGEVSFEEFAQIQRGQLLNARNRESSGVVQPVMMDRMPQFGAARTEEKETVDYLTDTVFLDGAGGGSLPGKDKTIAEPSFAFLLDPNGNLMVRSELDDKPEVEVYTPPAMPGGPGAWSGAEMPYSSYGPGSGLEDSPYSKRSRKGSDKGSSRGSSKYPSSSSYGPGPMSPGSSMPKGSGPSSGKMPPGYPGSGSGRMPPGYPGSSSSKMPPGYPGSSSSKMPPGYPGSGRMPRGTMPPTD